MQLNTLYDDHNLINFIISFSYSKFDKRARQTVRHKINRD